ncbi:hypothetical protein XENOCAPTIV_029780 [Xenoophorus captivus]|uniref:Uncharacterized protein n=1 Tax=Xenoophorus captivus TaxID=1517983 RepID=A0ABV0SC64_9TELE
MVTEQRLFLLITWNNLYEVSSTAVDADVRELQTDDLTGLSDDEGSTSQLSVSPQVFSEAQRGSKCASCEVAAFIAAQTDRQTNIRVNENPEHSRDVIFNKKSEIAAI